MSNFSQNDITKRVETVLGYLDTYAHCGGVYYEATGRANPISGKAFCRLCSACVRHARAGNFCRQAAFAGAYQSLAMGDIYNFRCWLGFRALVVPVSLDGEKITGVIEIGGILLHGELQNSQHQIIATLSSVGAEEHLPQFMSAFQGMEEMPELDINNLCSFLKEAVFSSGLLNVDKFSTNNAVWLQQKRLANELKTIGTKRVNIRRRFFLAIEELLNSLGKGDEAEIISKTDEILSLIMVDSSNDISSVKAHLVPVLSFVASDSLLKGEKWSKVMTVNLLHLEELEKISGIKELCFWFESLLLKVSRQLLSSKKESHISDKVISYLHQHFSEKVLLKDVSKAIGASSSSLMHKLKSETGRTFSGHLNAVRIKEAKRLLAFTLLSLSEISIRCGFTDQSYFSKVFKKTINIEPREFRRMLSSN